MDRKYIVALEISGTQVKGALASVTPGNAGKARTQIDTIVTEDNPDSVRHGRVQNLMNATKYTEKVINQLMTDPALEGDSITGCYVGLCGRSLASVQATTQLELVSETMIDDRILDRLYKEAQKHAPIGRQVVKVMPRKFYVDGVAQDDPVGSMGRTLRGNFTLIVCDPVNQRNLDMVIRDKCGLPVIEYIPMPIAMAGMVLGEEEKQLGCMLVDVGAQTTTVSIYKDSALQYLSTLPMGSFNITRDLSIGMNYTMQKAEITKCAQGNAKPDPKRPADENAKANSYVAARANEIVANVVASIKYAGYTYSDLPAGIILCGRGARLRNLDHLLREQSNMPLRRPALPTSMTFAMDDRQLKNADFISLLSIVNMVAKRPRFVNCVSTSVAAPIQVESHSGTDFVVDINVPTPDPAPTPVEPAVTPADNIFIDKHGTQEHGTQEHGTQNSGTQDSGTTDGIFDKPIKKAGLIARLKRKMVDMVSTDDIPGDSNLD